ncbi:DUF6053 domain-containing protein [Lysobacter yananisis]
MGGPSGPTLLFQIAMI